MFSGFKVKFRFAPRPGAPDPDGLDEREALDGAQQFAASFAEMMSGELSPFVVTVEQVELVVGEPEDVEP